MSDEQRWKAKYLESLEQQEKLERQVRADGGWGLGDMTSAQFSWSRFRMRTCRSSPRNWSPRPSSIAIEARPQ